MIDTKYLPTRILRGMINAIHDAIVITSAEGFDEPHPQIVYVNPAFTAISGYSFEEAIGKSPRMLQGPGTDRVALARINKSLIEGQSCREVILNYHKDGYSYWLDIQIVPLHDEDGRITHFAAIERDVTKQQRRLDRLQSLARQDFLTGIASSAALYEYMEKLTTTDLSASHTLLQFDLDDFKSVNKTVGHIAGDALLRKFAATLAVNMRRDDFVARVGDNKFALVLRDTDLIDARIIVSRILSEAHRLSASDPSCGHIVASAGVATFCSDSSIEQIFALADDALYCAKRDGKNAMRISYPKAIRKIA